MPKIGSSSTVVTGLTAAALAVVTLLALQARSSATTTTAAGGGKAGTKPGSSAPSTPGKGDGGTTSANPVPAGSGSGKRVVYSLSARRVWLVDGSGTVQTSFAVQPSAVSPSPGDYTVYNTIAGPIVGSDGTQIENIVLFSGHPVVIGFSAAVDGSMASPAPGKHTGGIRESVDDSKAVYAFATQSTKVVVVG